MHPSKPFLLQKLQKDYESLYTLSLEELGVLRREIFETIVETVLKNGGHLGSNLAVIDITLALHYVYRFPEDKLIFDVGHQAYAHKLLSGRLEAFKTLRQKDGLSGFTKRSESPFDPFGAGHSSTSVSAALGFAHARRLSEQGHNIVALVGDGALSGGMAFEAFNNIRYLNGQLLIVLNDNEMSISPPTGGLTSLLKQLHTLRPLRRFKAHMEQARKSFYEHIPERLRRKIPDNLLTKMFAYARQIPEALEESPSAEKNLLKAFGLRYAGPVDGHDLPSLIEILRDLKNNQTPTLLHIRTQKGRGFHAAEGATDKLHSVSAGASTKAAALAATQAPTYSELAARALCLLAERDPSIVAITAAMSIGTKLTLFQERFPARFFDVGIAELHGAGFAAGLAAGGLRAVFALYATFIPRALDSIIHDICLQGLPVCLLIDRAGITAEDGPTHYGGLDTSILSAVPDLVLAAPSDAETLCGLLATAMTLNRPMALRYPNLTAPASGKGFEVTEAALSPLPIGRGRVVQAGRDTAVISLGITAAAAFEALQRFEERHRRRLTLADMLFLKPLDETLLISLARGHDRFLVLEEGSAGGLYSAVLQCLNKAGLLGKIQLRTICLPDAFPPQASASEHRAAAGLKADGIFQTLEIFTGVL